MMASNPNFEYEGSSSIPYIGASNLFHYVPPSLDSIQENDKGKTKKRVISKIISQSHPPLPQIVYMVLKLIKVKSNLL